jgi:hypothetical protein
MGVVANHISSEASEEGRDAIGLRSVVGVSRPESRPPDLSRTGPRPGSRTLRCPPRSVKGEAVPIMDGKERTLTTANGEGGILPRPEIASFGFQTL